MHEEEIYEDKIISCIYQILLLESTFAETSEQLREILKKQGIRDPVKY